MKRAPDLRPSGPLPVPGLVRGSVGVGRVGTANAEIEFALDELVEVVWPLDGVAWTQGQVGTVTRVDPRPPWVFYQVRLQAGANTWAHWGHGSSLRHLHPRVVVADAALEPGPYVQAALL